MKNLSSLSLLKKFAQGLKSLNESSDRKGFKAKVFYKINKRMMEDTLQIFLFLKEGKVLLIEGFGIKVEYGEPMSFDASNSLLKFSINKEGMLKIQGSSPSVYSFEVTIIPL